MFTIRRFSGMVAAASAATLLLAACSGSGDDDSRGDDGSGDTSNEAPAQGTPGLESCADDPTTCNAGERDDGGAVTFLVNQGHEGSYNPLTSAGSSVYMTQMREGLDTPVGGYLPDGEWQYNHDLLVSDPELISEDPLSIRYEFRQEAVWSDSEPITMRDVLFQQKHQSGNEDDCSDCDPASSSFYDTTVSIEAEDESGKAFTITYEDGWSHPEWFARDLFTHPAHIADAEGFDWEDDPDSMADASAFFTNTAPSWSSGPYVLESWTPDETQVLVPNENWYGATQPTLDTIVKEIVSDQPAWVPATSNGELHGGAPASFTPDLHQQLAEIPGTYAGVNANTYSWEHADFNMDSVGDVALRKAIFTVIDSEDARQRIWGELDELPAMRTGLFLPQANEYHEDHLTETGYGTGDVEAARAILADAGYTGYESGGALTDPGGEAVPELRFAFLSGNDNRDTFTQLTQSYAADIGLTITPDPIPPDQLGTVLAEQDYDLVIFGWSGNPLIANGPFQFYHSTSGSNFGNLQNDDVDALVEEARNQLSLDETGRIHNETIPIILDDAYILPLWDTPDLVWVSEEFANIRDNSAFSSRAFYNTDEWGVLAQ